VGRDDTERYSENEGGDDWDLQANKKGIEHAKNIEYALMVGHPSEDTSSGQARRTTGGFNHFVTTNVDGLRRHDDGARVLHGAAADLPLRREGEVGVRVDARGRRAEHVPARQAPDPSRTRTTFGLRVMQYISPHGTLNLVTHWLLEGRRSAGRSGSSTRT
jgi:hypothetical protein